MKNFEKKAIADLSIPNESPYKKLSNACFTMKFITPVSNYGHLNRPKIDEKSLWSMGLWYIKIYSSQNQDLSTSLERPYEELLNALISFEIRHSKLKLWVVKERASK